MTTPTQLRSFWNEFENKPDNETSASSPTRSPIRSNRSSLQSNAFVQMDLNSSNRFNSPYSSPMSPQRHQSKSSQRESIGSSTKGSPVRPFNKENHSIPINTNESPSDFSKAMPTGDYDRFPLFMSTTSEPPAAPEHMVSDSFSADTDEYQHLNKNSRESDNFTKYLGEARILDFQMQPSSITPLTGVQPPIPSQATMITMTATLQLMHIIKIATTTTTATSLLQKRRILLKLTLQYQRIITLQLRQLKTLKGFPIR